MANVYNNSAGFEVNLFIKSSSNVCFVSNVQKYLFNRFLKCNLKMYLSFVWQTVVNRVFLKKISIRV